LNNQTDFLNLNSRRLQEVSEKYLLSLNTEEMLQVQEYFKKENRNPLRMELEVIAQTWSEHCRHKTMTGVVEYTENGRKETIKNLLKETVFRATKELDCSHCLSVFKDNAGIIDFDEELGIAMKVETHNHPSAIEPYGGASTGVGGVIRDILGCGLGAKPVLNIDVFCFGNLDVSPDEVPDNILHPERVYRGVVRGVRDYSNRMGIPTASGAVFFDNEYMYNPLVYCGTVGVIPKDSIEKKVSPGELIVAIGGRTGRDGIHGATFSSIGLDESVDVSCVQIGDPITEKKFTDALLKLRDKKLYTSVTDCGAGGFSSAVGEMARETGAEVRLENAPLKYPGLKPWEIFLSESQERMVMSVPEENIDTVKEILTAEDVEYAVLGKFTDSGRLKVYFREKLECDIDMEFLHEGLPVRRNRAVWNECEKQWKLKDIPDLKSVFEKMLSNPNAASKREIVSQYDHEVQGGSVLKPFSGTDQSVPQDGCSVRPDLDKDISFSAGLGINPDYGRVDPYKMALSSCDEAARNMVAAGGNITKAGMMDNFCWGDVNDEKILGELVRASKGCYSASKILGIPFVSGKDSLNNFYITEKDGRKINVPGTLLITCISPATGLAVSPGSNFKKPENHIYLIGKTYAELGGSLLNRVTGADGGSAPDLRKDAAFVLRAVSNVIKEGLVLAVHDLSEGGLGLTLCEMSMSGIGAEIDVSGIEVKESGLSGAELLINRLFSESNSRFLVEVNPEKAEKFEKAIECISFNKIGNTIADKKVTVKDGVRVIYSAGINEIKRLWQEPVKW